MEERRNQLLAPCAMFIVWLIGFGWMYFHLMNSTWS